jgi:hypothetical protein
MRPVYRAGDDPASLVDRWAYFFRETGHLKAVPPALARAPFARALEVARSSGFTPEEWEAYDRAKVAEQDARGALGLAQRLGREEGRAEGRAEGIKEGLTTAIEDLCEVLGVELTSERRASLARLDEPGLRALKARLLRTRQWD